MSLLSYKQHIFGSFGEEKEESRMIMEDDTLLLHKEVELSANVFCTLCNTALWQMHIHCHILANIGSFSGCFKIISLCLLMEKRKGLVTVILFEVINFYIKLVYK